MNNQYAIMVANNIEDPGTLKLGVEFSPMVLVIIWDIIEMIINNCVINKIKAQSPNWFQRRRLHYFARRSMDFGFYTIHGNKIVQAFLKTGLTVTDEDLNKLKELVHANKT